MKPDFLFEISWEACNKVGGIYAVLQSKAARMVEHYGETYMLLGPFFNSEKLKGEFEETAAPEEWKADSLALANEGIKLHWGEWLIEGYPRVCLIDVAEFLRETNGIKQKLWEYYQIDSLNAPDDFNHPIVWGWACGKALEIFASKLKDKKIVAHIHEWLAAGALLYVASAKVNIKTVFTTHATVMGRTIAEQGLPLYEHISDIDTLKEAYRYGVAAKHLTEKSAAKYANALTTVSEITAREVEHFLERKPDIILPNGLDLKKYPTMEEIAVKHHTYRERMREFLLYYFLPYYEIDIPNTLFYFISGRYEMENKGIDVFIKALGKVNNSLKKEKKSKTIITFLFIPTGVGGINGEIIENREHFNDIKRIFDEAHDTTSGNLLYGVIAGKELGSEFLLGKEQSHALEMKIKKLKKTGAPPTHTHDLMNRNDRILNLLREVSLVNQVADRVKVIYYPVYISGGDGLLNLDYEQVIMGSHFGIFPSSYEPWGYTPLETAALGVASLTTDMAGFGEFIGNIEDKETRDELKGIYVLERYKKSEDEVIQKLADIMIDYAKLSREERVENKLRARRLSEYADWRELIQYYFDAHKKALA